jgi:hypothetical protein
MSGPLRHLLAGLASLVAAWVDWPDEWVPIALAIAGLLCLGSGDRSGHGGQEFGGLGPGRSNGRHAD